MKKHVLMTFVSSIVMMTSACAQPAGSGQPAERPGPGPGMMSGGAGSGANPGTGGGYGYGPGMMGGYGPGMMGGYGPGMMGGYGPGMMGGYGAGRWAQNIPDLTDEQRSKIAAIQKEFRQKQWTLMESMHDNFQSGNQYSGGKFDEQAARKAYDASAALHKQMFENHLEVQKRIDSVLTPQQRERLQQGWRGR